MLEEYNVILVKGLKLQASIGIYDFEKAKKQAILVDVKAYTKVNTASKDDNIDNTVNYETIVNMVTAIVNERHYELVETLAETISTKLFDEFHAIQKVKITVKKPDIIDNVDYVGINIVRKR